MPVQSSGTSRFAAARHADFPAVETDFGTLAAGRLADKLKAI